MKHLPIFFLVIAIILTNPINGWAQEKFDLNSIKFDPSNLLPILSETDIIGAPDDAITLETMKKIDDRCLSKVPERFPPDAHHTYCACSTAATQGTITVGDLREIQKDKNRVLGNKAFEKYVSNVMQPCMASVIEDIEYMFCIMSRQNDWRIRLPIPYCKCTSRSIKKNFEIYGLEQMMIAWGRPKKNQQSSPIDMLWDNSEFLKSREMKKDECVGHYMHPTYFK
jgi:hypothetical protein